ncbi:DNA/RNA-binding domain of Phe-tRNA-synthetase-like protein [Scopulibacillus daqui]|uniref:DNA/RNA-binding domain of Phe-tRNA-synthetase-like protein n=1 Tax=Scopulibacillus daqui TaxID=1469162 RepID=A0ABS2Q3F7_9BACL|nr:phenylalanine--tRNA ligase beta subunit-related protein [Scopulibacillus daqui]MBM7646832.1 DNA/RNA-binding domain of Phe-tRNA-synthetase-like protein [Scopulibacillus daqui]
MHPVEISNSIKEKCPSLHIGMITYNDIVVSELPQMLKGRFQLFYEEIMLGLEEKGVTDIDGVAEWRSTFKTLGTDPSRYRPSHEALFRRLKKGQRLPYIHSAADINNFFSLKFEIPLGIYDLNRINGDVILTIGNENDQYEGINGRMMSMKDKLLTADDHGAFGSPIVDSKKTMVTNQTTNALQIVYFRPSTADEEKTAIINEITAMFTHIHGGEASCRIIN